MMNAPKPRYRSEDQGWIFRGHWHGHDIYLLNDRMKDPCVRARFGDDLSDYLADITIKLGQALFTAHAIGLDFETDETDPERERFMTEAHALAEPKGPWPSDRSRTEDGRVSVNIA
jgi:hypothetical protein